jgi:uncharacterized membrane protein
MRASRGRHERSNDQDIFQVEASPHCSLNDSALAFLCLPSHVSYTIDVATRERCMASFSQSIVPLTALAAVGSGLMSGLLFAFSNFVMKALTQLPAEQGMAAMQKINVAILNPVFLLLFMGTAVLCVVLTIYAVRQTPSRATVLLIAGSMCYLVGTVGVTMIFNVPLNNALAASQETDAWPSYVRSWLAWNHVRTVLTLGAALAFTFASSQAHRLTTR